MTRFAVRSVLALVAIAPASLPAQKAAVAPQPVLRIDDAPARRDAAAKAFPGAGPAIDLGIEWLLGHQDADGRWNADSFMAHDGEHPTDGAGNAAHDIGVTALAVLALAREGPARDEGPRRRAIERGAAWLAGEQEASGRIGAAVTHDFVYGHSIGTLALCAAAAATGSEPLRKNAQRALDYLEQHRNPFSVWRYQPRDNDNDTSVTTWAILANLAGFEIGLKVNRQAFALADVWFQQVTDAVGRVGYARQGQRSSRKPGDNAARFPPERVETLTAAGLMCRHAFGQTGDAVQALAKAQGLLLATPPAWTPDEGGVDHCYWFFGTEAMQGAPADARAAWSTKLVEALVKGQRVDAAFAGSWDPVDAWGDDGGRIYATAMSVLALQGLYAPSPPK